MRCQCGFDFRRANAVTGRTQDIVNTTTDPVISVMITPTPVTGKVEARVRVQ